MKKFLPLLSATVLLAASFAATALAQPEVIVQHKINPHSQSENRVGFAPTQGGTSATSPLIYHNGPLIGTPTVYLIWYGNWNQSNSSDTTAGKDLVKAWAGGIGNSGYFKINQTNSINGFNITGAVNYGGEITDTGTATRLSDSDILKIVGRNIGVGKLPYSANGVYFVITSSNIRKSGFCTQYCGWHTAGNVAAGHVRYSFVGNANRCLSSCAAQSIGPNGNAGIDGTVSVLSHELEEATTDPDLNAWYDSGGAENADKCAWTFGHFQQLLPSGAWYNMSFGGKNWLIQRNLYQSAPGSWFCMTDSTHN